VRAPGIGSVSIANLIAMASAIACAVPLQAPQAHATTARQLGSHDDPGNTMYIHMQIVRYSMLLSFVIHDTLLSNQNELVAALGITRKQLSGVRPYLLQPSGLAATLIPTLDATLLLAYTGSPPALPASVRLGALCLQHRLDLLHLGVCILHAGTASDEKLLHLRDRQTLVNG